MRTAAMVFGILVAGSISAQSRLPNKDNFRYVYPYKVSAIPALRARLKADARKLKRDFEEGGAEDRRENTELGFALISWSADYAWKVVADTPRFLSLSESSVGYSGGAHPNTAFDGLLWDKVVGSARDPASLFLSPSATKRALLPGFCRRLNAERHSKRSGKTNTDSDFDTCDDLLGTLLLCSSNGNRFDRNDFLIAPYDAGPYVEGSYEVTLPVTATILRAVRPEWRRYFMIGTP